MERRLIVMRHAKSSWAEEGLSDHQRPLNERGLRDAPRVAKRITELGWQPQCIVSSDARRTRETAKLMMSVWEDGIEANFLESLYLAGPREVAAALESVSDEVETLLVLGHNPGWEAVVRTLSGESVTLKTATAVLLKTDAESWLEGLGNEWTVEEIVYPRNL